MRKRTCLHVNPTKTSTNLHIRAVWESSLYVIRNFASLAIQNAPDEDSEHTAEILRLIRIFAGRITIISKWSETSESVRFRAFRLIC